MSELSPIINARVPCIVPFCRRTTRAGDPAIEWPDDGWICSQHWRAVPAAMKAVKRRARRALRAAGYFDEYGRFCGRLAPLRRFKRISARCTRAAIERAFLVASLVALLVALPNPGLAASAEGGVALIVVWRAGTSGVPP